MREINRVWYVVVFVSICSLNVSSDYPFANNKSIICDRIFSIEGVSFIVHGLLGIFQCNIAVTSTAHCSNISVLDASHLVTPYSGALIYG
jgi:hypothetical protein